MRNQAILKRALALLMCCVDAYAYASLTLEDDNATEIEKSRAKNSIDKFRYKRDILREVLTAHPKMREAAECEAWHRAKLRYDKERGNNGGMDA